MTGYVTRFGSLESFEKGSIEIIDDEPKHYTFSNIFEVASAARPWEKVAVGKNMEYVVEVIRALGPVGMLIISAFVAWLLLRRRNRAYKNTHQPRRNHAPRP